MINHDYIQKTKYLNPQNKSTLMEVANYVRNSYTNSKYQPNVILSDISNHLIEAQKIVLKKKTFLVIISFSSAAELPKSSRNKILCHFIFIILLTMGTLFCVQRLSDLIKLFITGPSFKVPIILLVISSLNFIGAVCLITFFVINSAKHKNEYIKIKSYYLYNCFHNDCWPCTSLVIRFSYYHTVSIGIIKLSIPIYYYKK